MAKLITVYWRDIPSQVIAKKGRTTSKVQLSHRFQEAIDRAAMRAGKGSSDAYLSEWRREASTCSDDLEEAPREKCRFAGGALLRRRSAGADSSQRHRSGRQLRPIRGEIVYVVRRWSVRNARRLELLYRWFEGVLKFLHPLWGMVGYERVERPVSIVEKWSRRSCSIAACVGFACSVTAACLAR
ncbi:MAG: hypothetical protein Ct9H300mP16_16550 [Pseudomonadota bacterium]|nr:MAG: hypothetical protein Ct9H300mP16_16550 [Pseudomonadota bacterium]